jgi:hypothetical protein
MEERGHHLATGPKHQNRCLFGSESCVRRGCNWQDFPGIEGDEPTEGLNGFLRERKSRVSRIGLEAEPLSQWLHAGLVNRDGFPITHEIFSGNTQDRLL